MFSEPWTLGYLIVGLLFGALFSWATGLPPDSNDPDAQLEYEMWHSSPLTNGVAVTLAIFTWPMFISVLTWRNITDKQEEREYDI